MTPGSAGSGVDVDYNDYLVTFCLSERSRIMSCHFCKNM